MPMPPCFTFFADKITPSLAHCSIFPQGLYSSKAFRLTTCLAAIIAGLTLVFSSLAMPMHPFISPILAIAMMCSGFGVIAIGMNVLQNGNQEEAQDDAHHAIEQP